MSKTDLNTFYQNISNGALPSSQLAGGDKSSFALLQEYFFKVEFDLGQNSLVPLYFLQRRPIVTDFQNGRSAFLKSEEQTAVRDILSLSVRSAELPNMTSDTNDEMISNDFGNAVWASKGYLIPDSQQLTIQFLNTEFNIIEHLIDPWLRETKNNIWVYPDRPYTKAKITISFFDQKMDSIIFRYIFNDCFPITYDTINPNHEASYNLERGATFTFNYMDVDRAKQTVDT